MSSLPSAASLKLRLLRATALSSSLLMLALLSSTVVSKPCTVPKSETSGCSMQKASWKGQTMGDAKGPNATNFATSALKLQWPASYGDAGLAYHKQSWLRFGWSRASARNGLEHVTAEPWHEMPWRVTRPHPLRGPPLEAHGLERSEGAAWQTFAGFLCFQVCPIAAASRRGRLAVCRVLQPKATAQCAILRAASSDTCAAGAGSHAEAGF